jgi:hypothetical protein
MSSDVGLGIRGRRSGDVRSVRFSELLDCVLKTPLPEFSSGTEDEEAVLREDSSELDLEAILVRDFRNPGIFILAIFSAKREGFGADFDWAGIVY